MNELHVIPADDAIVHDTNPDCVCAPTTEPVRRLDGSMGWVHTHHSLDGRDHHEETP